jgi:hypothetical protein
MMTILSYPRISVFFSSLFPHFFLTSFYFYFLNLFLFFSAHFIIFILLQPLTLNSFSVLGGVEFYGTLTEEDYDA